jgi:uncharacterized membrane protein YqjE
MTTEPRQEEESASRSAGRSMAQIAHDAIELAELQLRLISLDFRRAQTAAIGPALVLGLGLALAACIVPTALIGVALLIQTYGQTSLLAAFWWTVLLTIVLAVGTCAAAVVWFRRGPRFFESSHIEWLENLRWLKEVLDRASRSRGPLPGNGNHRRGNEQTGSSGRTF